MLLKMCNACKTNSGEALHEHSEHHEENSLFAGQGEAIVSAVAVLVFISN